MNPFRVLKVSREATQQEIIQAVPLALQRKEYTAREIADAQKELMNPRSRRVAEFIYFLDNQRWSTQGAKLEGKLLKERMTISDLPLLHSFDKFPEK